MPLLQILKGDLIVYEIDRFALAFCIEDQKLKHLVLFPPHQLLSGNTESCPEQSSDHRWLIIIDIIQQRGMNAYKRKGGHMWSRKDRLKSQNSNLTAETNLDTFVSLRQEVKKIQIMTRMDNRARTSTPGASLRRPNSEMNRHTLRPQTNDFRRVEKQYIQEKSMMKTVFQQNKKMRENQTGLLGEWRRYEQFSKQQLIEKLISLQHLANTIFKKNKHLEEQMQQLKTTAKQE